VATPLSRQIQLACDDLYCAPLDPVVQANVRYLLLRSTPAADGRAQARRIRIACDELHDDPTDLDARRTLLNLLDPSSTSAPPFRPDVPTQV
jgi:hypothetical protein